MTSHELARKLLEGEDLPVCYPLPHGDHRTEPVEIEDISESDENFRGSDGTTWQRGPHITLE